MSLNCNEINVILDELKLEGSFIQDIIQPGYDTIAFYTYGEEGAKTVLVCTAPSSCRINETRKKIVRNDKPLRFMEILRSRIKGSRIVECRQLGLMRIVLFSLVHGEEKFKMYVRLWSGAANVILCDENDIVLDAMFRRPKKGEMTGEKFLVEEEGAEENVSNGAASALEHRGTKGFDGELASKDDSAETSAKQSSKPARVWEVRKFPEITEKLRSEHGREPNFNEKVEAWYSENASSLSLAALLVQAEKWYTQSRTRMESALEKLEAKKKSFENAEEVRRQGDLILSNAHTWDGKSSFLECEDYETGRTVRILMDVTKSAQENAAHSYENYKKAVSGLEGVLHDIELSRKKIEKLDAQYEQMKNEKNPVRLEQLLRRGSTPKQAVKKSHPGLDYTVNGWYILVGRDANENDELLRHHVRGNDMWLHTRDFPGGYVFIKARPGKTVPLDVLLDAGNLAVHYSKARNTGKADLYYTEVKHLRRAKNGPKGLVLPTHEKNLCITPDKKRLDRLEELKLEE